jgi:hypothetical protein
MSFIAIRLAYHVSLLLHGSPPVLEDDNHCHGKFILLSDGERWKRGRRVQNGTVIRCRIFPQPDTGLDIAGFNRRQRAGDVFALPSTAVQSFRFCKNSLE